MPVIMFLMSLPDNPVGNKKRFQVGMCIDVLVDGVDAGLPRTENDGRWGFVEITDVLDGVGQPILDPQEARDVLYSYCCEQRHEVNIDASTGKDEGGDLILRTREVGSLNGGQRNRARDWPFPESPRLSFTWLQALAWVQNRVL